MGLLLLAQGEGGIWEDETPRRQRTGLTDGTAADDEGAHV